MAIAPMILEYLLRVEPKLPHPPNASCLEFGEAQTVSLSLEDWVEPFSALLPAPPERVSADILALRQHPDQDIAFEEAKYIYRTVLGITDYRAVDGHARNPDWRMDLDDPFDLDVRYDFVINNGTSEHVFNQANFFRLMHDHAKSGGVMIHYTTCFGWIDHGHYNIQPSFFIDLARRNNYKILSLEFVSDDFHRQFPQRGGVVGAGDLANLPDDVLICCCLQKTNTEAFKYPSQAAYESIKG